VVVEHASLGVTSDARPVGEATGSSAPIDRPTFLRGRTAFEEPCPPNAKVTRSNRVGPASLFD
jgi:hypothetical protein